ncbi:hypothetical protein [uncultured Hydrogenophaga sp.]|uniref:hypothetical protein n=1 Tax=uncultured Hydrogenophaga sp. TaxID=199683 RepID=UPI00258C13E9|nr:hypothetical protein [uncultured Hydrogenophaga sp.]
MSDEQAIPAASETPLPVVARTDWFLQTLVSTVTSASASLPVTICVGGSVITGELISGKRYFNEFADAIAAGMTDETREDVRNAYRAYGKQVYGDDGSDAESINGGEPPQYLHLAKAKYITTDGRLMPSPPGMLWRGRISAVAGWSYGTFEPSP